jgi:hypothetical protein
MKRVLVPSVASILLLMQFGESFAGAAPVHKLAVSRESEMCGATS